MCYHRTSYRMIDRLVTILVLFSRKSSIFDPKGDIPSGQTSTFLNYGTVQMTYDLFKIG